MSITEQIAENRRQRAQHTTAVADLDEQLAGPDGLISQAFAQGHTGPEIAAAAGLSKQRVYQIRDATR